MARARRHTAEEVCKAIEGSMGVKTAVAAKLGVHRHTVTNYLKAYASARKAMADERGALYDAALVKAMKMVELSDWRAVSYVLHNFGDSDDDDSDSDNIVSEETMLGEQGERLVTIRVVHDR